jgi:hypothetical protein
VANYPASATGSVSVSGSAFGGYLAYTITKVALTTSGNLYVVVDFPNGLVNDFEWADISPMQVTPTMVLQAMAVFADSVAAENYQGNMCDPHITVNPNVGGVPAALAIMNGRSGTI